MNKTINSFFNFNEKKILEIAKATRDIGAEMFVLDDGWFGKRDDDSSSLGDWFVNKNKFPNGLKGLSNGIKNRGMKFGIWIEPEMVSVDSDLYRAHPDWCIHVPGRIRTETRNQLTLDLSRKEVCDYIVEAVSKVLDEAPISYVKWDMNRMLTDNYSTWLEKNGKEMHHRYVLGLYEICERLVNGFPNIIF